MCLCVSDPGAVVETHSAVPYAVIGGILALLVFTVIVCSSSPSGAPSDRKVTSSLHKHLTCGDTLTCGTSPSEEMEEVANIQAVERVSVEDKGWFTLHQHQPGSITHSNPSLLVFGAVRASMNKNWIKESSSWCYKVGLYKILYDGRNITL